MRLYGALKTKLGRQKFKGNIKFEILGKNQEEFRQKINRIYHSLYSFDDYSSDYWKWYYIDRPKGQESVVLAAKEKNSIIAGGVMIRSHLMVIDTRKRVPVYVLSEFFVDPAYRRSGLGSYVLSQLESIIKQKGGSVVITTLHGRDTRFQEFLKHMGYIIIKKAVVQMIKPISERSIQLFRIIEGKKMVWKVPLEQLGY
jgi:GNAT superfamily N-acetyltransferase